jgi:thioredoxin 1
MVRVLTHENYEEIVSSEGVVLVDCWATWCGACETFTPIFERVSEKNPDHLFAKMDTEEQEELVKEFGIQHIPALMVFRDGILLFKQPSNFNEQELEGIIAQAESVDMDAVRAQISAQEKQEQ